MEEEEKKAIEYWKQYMSILHWNTQLASEYYLKVLLDLIEKQNNKIDQLEKENKELKATYRNMANHFEQIGKIETAEYMLAQIEDVPVWTVD